MDAEPDSRCARYRDASPAESHSWCVGGFFVSTDFDDVESSGGSEVFATDSCKSLRAVYHRGSRTTTPHHSRRIHDRRSKRTQQCGPSFCCGIQQRPQRIDRSGYSATASVDDRRIRSPTDGGQELVLGYGRRLCDDEACRHTRRHIEESGFAEFPAARSRDRPTATRRITFLEVNRNRGLSANSLSLR